MAFIFTNKEFIIDLKNKIKAKESCLSRVNFELRQKAEEYMMLGPWSVTYDKSPAASNNKHDYFSEGPYWWPDPENPNGPYIRRDGEFNPNVFMAHKSGLVNMSRVVLLLAQAGYYLDKKRFAKRAVKLIKTWFLDKKTMMNPHFEYAQAIRGVCDGRGIGLIDAREFIAVIYAAGFIEEIGGFEKEIKDLKAWFEQFLNWMNTSEKGIEERDYFNNHANWWNAQAAAYAAFVGNIGIYNECIERYKSVIIPSQTDSEGKFIDEISRTRSYTYSLFNLEAAALTCEIALINSGEDLWHFETADGKGIGRCFEFLKPYYENPFAWKYSQISMKESTGDKYAFQLGALRLNNEEYARINRERAEDMYLIRQACTLGSLALLPGFEF